LPEKAEENQKFSVFTLFPEPSPEEAVFEEARGTSAGVHRIAPVRI
jgi:hypothetical protein